jgi:hypothetical protein
MALAGTLLLKRQRIKVDFPFLQISHVGPPLPNQKTLPGNRRLSLRSVGRSTRRYCL